MSPACLDGRKPVRPATDELLWTATPLASASSSAPDTTNKNPYRMVSRIRTVRPGSRSQRGRLGWRWARMRPSLPSAMP